MFRYHFKDTSYNKKLKKKFRVEPKLSKAMKSCVKIEIEVIIQLVVL